MRGGSSTHWHCSRDSKFKAILSSQTILYVFHFFRMIPIAFLSKDFVGASQYMATQGCCRNARFATTKSSRDSTRLNLCTIRLKISLLILNVIDSMKLHSLQPPVQQDDTDGQAFTLICPCVLAPPTHHTQSIQSDLPMHKGNQRCGNKCIDSYCMHFTQRVSPTGGMQDGFVQESQVTKNRNTHQLPFKGSSRGH